MAEGPKAHAVGEKTSQTHRLPQQKNQLLPSGTRPGPSIMGGTQGPGPQC